MNGAHVTVAVDSVRTPWDPQPATSATLREALLVAIDVAADASNALAMLSDALGSSPVVVNIKQQQEIAKRLAGISRRLGALKRLRGLAGQEEGRK